MSNSDNTGIGKKKSDDIVSLDSWNDAISPQENSSPVDNNVFFEGDQSCLTVSNHGHVNQGKTQRGSHPKRLFSRDASHQSSPNVVSESRQKSSFTASKPLILDPSTLDTQATQTERMRNYKHRNDNTGESKFPKHNQQELYKGTKEQAATSPRDSSGNTKRFVSDTCREPDRMFSQMQNTSIPETNYQYHKPKSKNTQSQEYSANQNIPNSLTHQYINRINHPFFGKNMSIQGHHLKPDSSTYPPSSRIQQQFQQTSQTDPVDDDLDQSEKMKNKIMSVWNNVRYGWTIKTKTSFKCDSPIFLLGCCYHIRPSDDLAYPGERIHRLPSIERFKQDFSSQLWFTYRQDFPTIAGTKLTTDCGWGCMLRSGQMMLARAFVNHFLGRDWSVFREQTHTEDTYRKQIIRWFGDFPGDQTPFSVHRLAEIGKTLGKGAGEWYGPSSVAHIFRECMLKAYDVQPILRDVCIYVSQDCTIYKKDIYDMCCGRSRTITKFGESTESESEKTDAVKPTDAQGKDSQSWKQAVIVLVPVRLGGEEFNPVYTPCIKSLLAQDNCIGIIGGKPKHSLYFVGFQEDKLIYLDPHYCQDAVDTRERNFPLQSYHCLSPRKISITKMDPSCTIGFYCRNQKEFETFVTQSEAMVSPPKQKMSYPMFVFSEGKGSDVTFDSLSLDEDKLLRIRHVKTDEYGRIRSSTIESEEFVVL